LKEDDRAQNRPHRHGRFLSVVVEQRENSQLRGKPAVVISLSFVSS
jgi:hypothetical protein